RVVVIHIDRGLRQHTPEVRHDLLHRFGFVVARDQNGNFVHKRKPSLSTVTSRTGPDGSQYNTATGSCPAARVPSQTASESGMRRSRPAYPPSPCAAPAAV